VEVGQRIPEDQKSFDHLLYQVDGAGVDRAQKDVYKLQGLRLEDQGVSRRRLGERLEMVLSHRPQEFHALRQRRH